MFIWDAPAVGPLKSILVYTPVEVTAIGNRQTPVTRLTPSCGLDYYSE